MRCIGSRPRSTTRSAGTTQLTKNQTFDPFDRVTFQAEKVGAQSSVSTRYAFGGGNPIGRVELNGHMNREESYGGGFTTENLERCGSGCSLDGSNPVSGSSGDSFNNAVDNVFVGMLSGGIKTVEAAAAGPLAPILALTGAGVGSQFDNFAADHGAETDSAAFTAGEIIGIPIPAGAGAKVADRTAITLADKAAAKLADNAAAQDAVAALRASGSAGAKRNIAAAEVSIEGTGSYLLRSVSGATGRPGMVPGVGSPGNPQRFLPTATGSNNRFSDTEFKILNSIANKLGPSSSSVRGTITLYSELPVCSSCSSVISQFSAAFPNVVLNVTTG
jgi:hypothetical protein